MKIDIPHFVEDVLNRLSDNGYETYLVGGCIRDILMGKPPKDWDITTSALPHEILEVFIDRKVVNTGAKYGTVTVILKEGKVEVTTFRSEGAYSDGRHPDWVYFEKTIEADLSRRDFTINSIAFNNAKGLVDLFGGIEDINKGLIRTVGNSSDRFIEDGLRMIRAVRFAANLNFNIHDETLAAMQQLAEKIKTISAERVRDEFFQVIAGANPTYGMNLLLEAGLTPFVLPEILPIVGFEQNNPYHDKDVFKHTLCVLEQTPNVLHIRLAALFHDIGKPYSYTLDDEGIGHFYGHNAKGVEIAIDALKRLRCPNKLIKQVTLLVDYHMKYYKKNQKTELKRLIGEIGRENISDLLILQKADAMCKKKLRLIANAVEMETAVEEIFHQKEPIFIEELAISGDDLKQLGLEQGVIIGKVLDELLNIVLEKPELNEKDTLMEIAHHIWLKLI
ncbi:MAG: HD domain-containing protein [Lutispora sp.]|nr:HD domain-containing protein [Lutispora sp.]MDD4834104.1 HD domain-containing protein [Lutispora sp.]